ncbi:MAG: class I SAM-dependent methyltransferase, partial [Anaerolineae bacterium]
PLTLPWGTMDWVRYPGTFARAGVDPGTALLLDHLPMRREGGTAGSRVLDVGAGTGLLAAGVRAAEPDADVWLAEPDAPARAAAAENVPGARFASVAGWPEEGPWNRIVSNPPYHQGKGETLQVVRDLIRGARRSLAPQGELRLVIQRRHPVEAELRESFRRVEAVADAGPYRVWAALEAESRWVRENLKLLQEV